MVLEVLGCFGVVPSPDTFDYLCFEGVEVGDRKVLFIPFLYKSHSSQFFGLFLFFLDLLRRLFVDFGVHLAGDSLAFLLGGFVSVFNHQQIIITNLDSIEFKWKAKK